MAVHKLFIEEFEASYSLVAIHSSLEDYRMAYALNRTLAVALFRQEKDVDFPADHISFARYEWKDKIRQLTWNLVNNTTVRTQNKSDVPGSLFDEIEVSTINYHLIPEQPKIDYFLKIEGDYREGLEQEILSKLQQTPQIIAAYAIDADQLKSKNNLIFK